MRDQLNRNSSNSSIPPSKNPLNAKLPPKAPASGKKRGGQPGHPKRMRAILEPTRIIDVHPVACSCCGDLLLGVDPNPLVHQQVEIPPVKPLVTEYRQHRMTCGGCGQISTGELPAEAKHSYGPRLQAITATLVGRFRLGKRPTRELLKDMFGVPISAAQICKLEKQTAEALKEPMAEALEYVRTQPVNVDETSWRQSMKRAWMWVATMPFMTVILIQNSRSRKSFRELMGENPKNVITSDRYSAYSHLPAALRQLCWSHLQRDFQAMIDRKNDGQRIGERLVQAGSEMLKEWKRVRDGTLTREKFRTDILPPLQAAVEKALDDGRECGCAKTVGVCAELHRWKESLWTFAKVEGVEPTNNLAERQLRHGVCYRKTSYGTFSDDGSRFVERIMTVEATCKQQGRSVLEFLIRAIQAHRQGKPAPSLLPI